MCVSSAMKVLLVQLALVLAVNANVIPPSGAPRAPCTWNINTLPDPQALYINPSGPKDVRGFMLPQSGDTVSVNEGEQVIFACPGGTLGGVGDTDALMTCVGGSQWSAPDGSTYSFTTLKCSKNPFHDSIKREDLSCNIPGDNSFMQIGFQLSNGDFYVIMETCFADATGDSLYSVYWQTPAIGGYQSGYPRPGFVQGPWYPAGLDVDGQYAFNGQFAAFTKSLGSSAQAGKYLKSGTDYFLSRGHMSAKADFVYGAHQRATFWFLNVAPQWQTVNGANWNNLEMSTRAFADTNAEDLIVYTGTHGISTLPDINGVETDLYIAYDANDNGLLRVPAFYWRVVYEPTSGKGIAFVGLNNPYIDNPGSDFYLCPDICDQITWVNWSPTNQKNGYAYCCEVGALAPFVEEIPPLDVTGILV